MANIEQNVNLNFETNASEVKTEVDGLNKSLSNTNDLNVKQSGSTDDLTKKTGVSTNTFKANSTAVLENGGAMGLLNDLTGGYAMMVKDAVEASVLFISKKKADVVVTEAQTVATTTQTSSTWLATAAQEALNLAVSLNPYVLLATALVAVTAGLVYYVKTTNDAAEASARLDSAIYLTTENTKKYATAIKEAKAAKDYDNDIEIMRAKQLGLSGKALDKYIEKLKAADLEEARIAASKAYRMFQESGTQVSQAIAGGDEKQLAAAKANQTALYDLYKSLNADFDNAILEGNRRREENRLKYYEKEVADQKAANDRKIASEKTAQEKETQLKKAHTEYIQGLAKENADFGKTEKQIELDAIDALYEKDFAEAKKREETFSADLIIITEKRRIGILKVNEKYDKLQSDSNKKFLEDTLTAADTEQANDLLKQRFEENYASHNDYENALENLRIEKNQAALDAQKIYGEDKAELEAAELERTRYFAEQEAIIATHKYDAELDGAKMLLESLTSINNDNVERQLNAAGDDEEKKEKIRRKAFENNKKLQLGLAVVTGIQAGLSAYAAGVAAFPGPGALAMGAVFAGISAVTTLASIAKIASSKYGGNSGGASTGTNTGGGAAVATPSVTFQSSSDNQLASAVNKTQQNVTPIKTYVVASEVTTQQELDRKTTTSTSVG